MEVNQGGSKPGELNQGSLSSVGRRWRPTQRHLKVACQLDARTFEDSYDDQGVFMMMTWNRLGEKQGGAGIGGEKGTTGKTSLAGLVGLEV